MAEPQGWTAVEEPDGWTRVEAEKKPAPAQVRSRTGQMYTPPATGEGPLEHFGQRLVSNLNPATIVSGLGHLITNTFTDPKAAGQQLVEGIAEPFREIRRGEFPEAAADLGTAALFSRFPGPKGAAPAEKLGGVPVADLKAAGVGEQSLKLMREGRPTNVLQTSPPPTRGNLALKTENAMAAPAASAAPSSMVKATRVTDPSVGVASNKPTTWFVKGHLSDREGQQLLNSYTGGRGEIHRVEVPESEILPSGRTQGDNYGDPIQVRSDAVAPPESLRPAPTPSAAPKSRGLSVGEEQGIHDLDALQRAIHGEDYTPQGNGLYREPPTGGSATPAGPPQKLKLDAVQVARMMRDRFGTEEGARKLYGPVQKGADSDLNSAAQRSAILKDLASKSTLPESARQGIDTALAGMSPDEAQAYYAKGNPLAQKYMRFARRNLFGNESGSISPYLLARLGLAPVRYGAAGWVAKELGLSPLAGMGAQGAYDLARTFPQGSQAAARAALLAQLAVREPSDSQSTASPR